MNRDRVHYSRFIADDKQVAGAASSMRTLGINELELARVDTPLKWPAHGQFGAPATRLTVSANGLGATQTRPMTHDVIRASAIRAEPAQSAIYGADSAIGEGSGCVSPGERAGAIWPANWRPLSSFPPRKGPISYLSTGGRAQRVCLHANDHNNNARSLSLASSPAQRTITIQWRRQI